MAHLSGQSEGSEGRSGRSPRLALVACCPSDDLEGLVEVLRGSEVALLPVGGVGDLPEAAGVDLLLVVEITEEGARPTITWRGLLSDRTPVDPDPVTLLPASWTSRHPDAYLRSRHQRAALAPVPEPWDDEDEPLPTQVFLPVVSLEAMDGDEWIFANELVPKQRREGRTFAPRVPTLVLLPDSS